MRRLLVAVPLALAVGCGTLPSSPSSSGTAAAPSSTGSSAAAPAVPGVEAEVVRLRSDEAAGGRVQVRITATGDAPFVVTSVRLASEGFQRLPATAVEASFGPGRTIDLPTPVGEPVCAATPLPAVAEVTVVRPDGAVEDARVPVTAAVLERMHAEECAALGVLEVVRIEVAGLREDGDVLRGELGLSRRSGADSVTLSRLGRSVLLAADADGLPAELAGQERAVTVPVTFTPATCDAHVLSETKKPYVFPLTVRVGDDPEVSLDLPLDDDARALLAALVQRVCAQGR